MKILIVDDSSTVRSALESDGHVILEAPDGVLALAALESQAPIDAVILDWNMPVLNGFDCLQRIRADPAHNRTKVVMCTTEAEKSRVMRAIKGGANGYVIKPIDAETLKAQLAKVCGAPV